MATWRRWIGEGPRALSVAIIFAAIVFAWMFAFETLSPYEHRNRFTGMICRLDENCWFSREPTIAEAYERQQKLEQMLRDDPSLRKYLSKSP